MSNRCLDVKHKFIEETRLGAWLSSRSTLAAAWWSFAGRAFNVDDIVPFRKHTPLPLDHCGYAQATIPHLTRSSLP